MGSEMCIRDSLDGELRARLQRDGATLLDLEVIALAVLQFDLVVGCLLYTSDAADERSSVDLGGRRIIKNKNNAADSKHTC